MVFWIVTFGDRIFFSSEVERRKDRFDGFSRAVDRRVLGAVFCVVAEFARIRAEPEVSSGWAPPVVRRGRGGARRGGLCALRIHVPEARSAGNGKRPTGAVIVVPRGSANRERRRRRRGAPARASDQRERFV